MTDTQQKRRYTHTSIVLPCEVDAFCADCENPLPLGSPARRRVTDTGKPVFRKEWICGSTCGPIIDVSDDTLMRKRIAALEEEVSRARHDRDVALELAQQSRDEAAKMAEVLTIAERECEQLREQLRAARGAQASTANEVEVDMSPIEVDYPGVASTDRISVSLTNDRRVQVMVSEGGPNDAYRHSRTIQMPTNLARRLIYQLDRAIRAIEGESECAPVHPAEARVRELEAELEQMRASEETVRQLAEVRRGRMIGDLDNWLTRLLADYQPDDDYALAMLLNDLSDALECLRSSSKWIR